MLNLVPNVIRIITGSNGTAGSSITCGTFNVGIDPTGTYGYTPNSGFWNGITPPERGYTIYSVVTGKTSGPSITCHDDTSIVSWVNATYATAFTRADEAIKYINVSSGNSICVNYDYPYIPLNSLVFNYDCWFTSSYPTVGSVIYDTSGFGRTASIPAGSIYSVDTGIYLQSNQTIVIPRRDPDTYFPSNVNWAFVLSFSISSFNVGLVSLGLPSSNGFSIYIDSSAQLYIACSSVDILLTTNMLTGTLYSLAMSFSTTTGQISISLDGVVIYTLAANLSVTATDLVLGKAIDTKSGVYNSNCSIYSFKKYSRALSTTDIYAIVGSIRGIYQPGDFLVGYDTIGSTSNVYLFPSGSAFKFIPTQSGTIVDANVYLVDNDYPGIPGINRVSLGIFSDSGAASSSTPVNLVASSSTEESPIGTPSWVNFPGFNERRAGGLVVTAGVPIWIAVWTNAPSPVMGFTDPGSTGQSSENASDETYPNWNTWDNVAFRNVKLSVYLTVRP